MFIKIRDWIDKVWWFHLQGKCPICHVKVIEMGFPEEFGYHYYKCPNRKCRWN
jgi:hypothetical protein